MKILYAFIFLFWSYFVAGQVNFDVLHYDLHLVLDPNQKQIAVNEALHIRLTDRTTQIKLDLVGPAQDKMGLIVSGVTAPYQNIKWRQTANQLIIDLPKQLQQGDIQLFVKMSGQALDGLIIGNNKFGASTIFADNWPNRAHYWYACHDHPSDKATYQFTVQAPINFEVVANGNLVSKIQKDKNRNIEWSYKITVPIPTKVAVLGVADLVSKQVGEVDGIPIIGSVYPQDSVIGLASFEVAPEILDFYQKTVGPYPFMQLNNVQSTTRYGGMENAGCIFYDEASLNNNRKSKLLIAHEIAHQWFGNSVTETDWQHLWLSEGFATYLTNYYIEQTEGQAPFRQQLIQDRNRVINFSKRFQAPLVDSLTADLNERLNPNAYQKGSWVLHMLRVELGDSLFWSAIQSYYGLYKYKNASSEDFAQSILSGVKDAATKARLEAFFDQWFYQVGHPQIKAELKTKDGQQYLNISQTQKLLFSFPLKVAFYDESNNIVLLRYQIAAKENSFALPENLKDKKLRFELDPFTELLFEQQ